MIREENSAEDEGKGKG